MKGGVHMECGCGNHHESGNDCCGGGHEDRCGCGQGFQRRFKTKAEKLEMLKSYQADLEAELTAVKEKIKDLT